MIKKFNDKKPRIAESAYIAETSYIMGDVEIGENCIVSPGAVLRADFGSMKLTQNVWVEDNCVLHSGMGEMIIGNNVILGHSAVVHCSRIGNNVLVGMNSTLLHNSEIGNDCIIGAMTLVMEGMKIPDKSFVAGVPGEIKGQVTEKQSTWISGNPDTFAQFAQQYKAGKALDKNVPRPKLHKDRKI